MKRIIALTALLTFAAASLAFAAGTDVSTYTSPKFNASANVKVFADANDTTFAAAAKHLNGTRTFGVSSASTTVKYSESVAAGTPITGSNVSASDSSAFSSWSSL